MAHYHPVFYDSGQENDKPRLIVGATIDEHYNIDLKSKNIVSVRESLKQKSFEDPSYNNGIANRLSEVCFKSGVLDIFNEIKKSNSICELSFKVHVEQSLNDIMNLEEFQKKNELFIFNNEYIKSKINEITKLQPTNNTINFSYKKHFSLNSFIEDIYLFLIFYSNMVKS